MRYEEAPPTREGAGWEGWARRLCHWVLVVEGGWWEVTGVGGTDPEGATCSQAQFNPSDDAL